MQPFLADPDFRLYVGEAGAVLAELPADSVDCVVTSPPYFGLRDYGTGSWEGGDPACDHKQGRDGSGRADGVVDDRGQRNRDGAAALTRSVCRCGAIRVDDQVGLEASPVEYVEALVAVFAEVRRVLAPHGTLWVNLGDTYCHDLKWGGKSGNKNEGRVGYPRPPQRRDSGVKPKELLGIPWRVAFALQDDGWYLRSDVIWAKPNAMPESVTDRPTKSHEYVFMLTKQPRYYFDQEAVREPYEGAPEPRYGRVGADQERAMHGEGDGTTPLRVIALGQRLQVETLPGLPPETPRGPDGRRASHVSGSDGSIQHRDGERWPNGGRNIRTVWEIATQPYPEAHFATFPEALPERCIKAGCPEYVCRTCGKPRERIVERARTDSRPGISVKLREITDGNAARTGRGGDYNSETVGWSDCGHANYRPGVVLDPFMGSGTTALVARKLGRHAVGIELNPDYAALAAKRNAQQTIFA